MLLRSPLPGLLTRLVKLVVADFRAWRMRGLPHILASAGCNLEPHTRKLGIGFHTNSEVESICQVDSRLHVPVLSGEEEQP
jgi:hypothetical protein